MAQVNVTVAAATEFSTNASAEILTLTFTNTAAFTPEDSTNYYYTVTLEESGKTTTEFAFKVASDGTAVTTGSPKSFTIDNTTTQFTNAATTSLEAIYYTKSTT